MSWGTLGYALACVVVPMAWGILVVWVSNRIEGFVLGRGKGSPGRQRKELPRIEYHI